MKAIIPPAALDCQLFKEIGPDVVTAQNKGTGYVRPVPEKLLLASKSVNLSLIGRRG